MKKHKRLLDAYRFEGFVQLAQVRGVFGDPLARIISFQRRGKKRYVGCAEKIRGSFTIENRGWCGISLAGITGYTWKWKFVGFTAKVAAR